MKEDIGNTGIAFCGKWLALLLVLLSGLFLIPAFTKAAGETQAEAVDAEAELGALIKSSMEQQFSTKDFELYGASGSIHETYLEVDWDLTLFTDYIELVDRLDNIVAESDGRVELEVIGESNLGKDLFLATVGSGDTPVMIFAHVHGSESISSEAALRVLKTLGTSDDPFIENILAQLTVYIIPRVNPDGGEPDVLTYENVDPDVPPPWHEMGIYTDYERGWNIGTLYALDWEEHPLYQYEEPALQISGQGMTAGKVFTNSADYEGVEGLLIGCGDGAGPADFPAEVNGNIALIERGGGQFEGIVQNAFDAGAVGVVFFQDQSYDSDDQDNFLPRFSLSSPPEIPAMTIPRPDALDILSQGGPVQTEIIKNTYPENPSPEAQAVVDTVVRLNPIWTIDVHCSNHRIGDNNRTATSQVMWTHSPEAAPELVDMGKQIAVAMQDSVIDKYEFANVTQYGVILNPYSSRNAFVSLGITPFLLELWIANAAPYSGMVNQLGYEQLLAVLGKTADESLYEIDPDRVSELPPWPGNRVPFAEARDNIAPSYMSFRYPDEIEDAVAAIAALPAPANVTMADLEQLKAVRQQLRQLMNLGVPQELILNLDKLKAAEEKLNSIFQSAWFNRDSLFDLGNPGSGNYSGLGMFVAYDDTGRWTLGNTINGINLDPLRVYRVSHSNLTTPRWIEYDVSGWGYQFVEGYAGIVDNTVFTMYPLDLEIFIDGDLAFEARLEHRIYPIFYRLDLRGAEKVRFQWSAQTLARTGFANRIAFAEPQFLSFDSAEAIAGVEASIANLPAEISMDDWNAVKDARFWADGVLAFGVEPAAISNYQALVEAEDAIAALLPDYRAAVVDDAVDAIAALPANITYDDKSVVEEARSLVDYALSLGAAFADITNLDDLIAAEAVIEELDEGEAGLIAAIEAANAAIAAMPAAISLQQDLAVKEARALVEDAFSRGAETSDIPALSVLEAAESQIASIKSALYNKESLFVLGSPGAENWGGLGMFVAYTNEDRWTTGNTINGVNYDPHKMYTVSHTDLTNPRWIEYDIGDKDYDSVEGYVGVVDYTTHTGYPLDFEIYVDGELVFEAFLEYNKDAFHYFLDLRGAEKLKFQWSARNVTSPTGYGNRIGFVEPQFNLQPDDNGVPVVEAAIAALPAPGDLTKDDIDAVREARALADSALYLGAGEADIANLGDLVTAEEILDELRETVYGDVNQDELIDIRDVILTMQYVLVLTQLDENQQEAADVNGDEVINIDDVVLMMQFILGLIEKFPVEV